MTTLSPEPLKVDAVAEALRVRNLQAAGTAVAYGGRP
jgi:hypothetical protein